MANVTKYTGSIACKNTSGQIHGLEKYMEWTNALIARIQVIQIYSLYKSAARRGTKLVRIHRLEKGAGL